MTMKTIATKVALLLATVVCNTATDVAAFFPVTVATISRTTNNNILLPTTATTTSLMTTFDESSSSSLEDNNEWTAADIDSWQRRGDEQALMIDNAWRQALPSPLNKYRTKSLQMVEAFIGNDSSVDVFVIGTAHVSNDSARDVRLLLDTVQPDVVFVEICSSRLEALRETSSIPNGEQPKKRRMRRDEGGMNRFQELLLRRLAKMQENMAADNGQILGGEFIAAYDYWRGRLRNNATFPLPLFVLGDRPFEITAARLFGSMRKRDAVKMLWSCCDSTVAKVGLSAAVAVVATVAIDAFSTGWGSLVSVTAAYFLMMSGDSDSGNNDGASSSSTKEEEETDETRQMDQQRRAATDLLFETGSTDEIVQSILYKTDDDDDDDNNDLVEELLEDMDLPFTVDALVGERDVYMGCKLYQTLQLLQQRDDNNNKQLSIVAVVGAIHVDGICICLNDLLSSSSPPPNVVDRLLPLLEAKGVNERVAYELATSVCWRREK